MASDSGIVGRLLSVIARPGGMFGGSLCGERLCLLSLGLALAGLLGPDLASGGGLVGEKGRAKFRADEARTGKPFGMEMDSGGAVGVIGLGPGSGL